MAELYLVKGPVPYKFLFPIPIKRPKMIGMTDENPLEAIYILSYLSYTRPLFDYSIPNAGPRMVVITDERHIVTVSYLV